MPSLIASYYVPSAGADTSNLVTPSFTPANGEVIIVKLATWDTANPMGAVSGGGQTYTTRKTAAPGGFACWARVDTATISGSPGSMQITAIGTGSNSRHSMVVERWGSASLAVTPAVNAVVSGSGAPAFDVTTTAANSAISWASCDVNSIDPATVAYRLSGTQDGLFDGHVGANSVQYFAYAVGAAITAAGTYTAGESAPGGQNWVGVAVEILDAGGTTWTVDQTDNAGLTDTTVLDQSKAITDSAGLTDTATLARSNVVTDSAGLTDNLTLARQNTATDSAGLTDTATLSRTSVVTDSVGLTDPASLSGSQTFTDTVGLTDGAIVASFTPGAPAPEWAIGAPYTAWRAGNAHPKWNADNPSTAWWAGRARGRL